MICCDVEDLKENLTFCALYKAELYSAISTYFTSVYCIFSTSPFTALKEIKFFSNLYFDGPKAIILLLYWHFAINQIL